MCVHWACSSAFDLDRYTHFPFIVFFVLNAHLSFSLQTSDCIQSDESLSALDGYFICVLIFLFVGARSNFKCVCVCACELSAHCVFLPNSCSDFVRHTACVCMCLPVVNKNLTIDLLQFEPIHAYFYHFDVYFRCLFTVRSKLLLVCLFFHMFGLIFYCLYLTVFIVWRLCIFCLFVCKCVQI